MAPEKRRTEIQVETHEITIITFGKLDRLDQINTAAEVVDVTAHAEPPDSPSAVTEESRKENQYEKQS